MKKKETSTVQAPSLKNKMFFMMYLKVLLCVLIFLSTFFLLYKPAKAQFEEEFGSISGTILWGTEYVDGAKVYIEGNTSGYNTDIWLYLDYNTGFILPSDTYSVTGFYDLQGYQIPIGSQTVAVAGGESITDIDFDASTVTGLVSGSLQVNGVPSGGIVQFCGPNVTDSCPLNSFSGNNPWMMFGYDGFRVPLLPGDYRVQVTTHQFNFVGIIPITVSAGQVLDLTTSSVIVPVGQDVTVSLGGVEVTFSEVTTSGIMSVSTSSHPQGVHPPSQYRFLGTYYELTTTAAYIAPVTVRFTYNDADVHGQESNLKLFHWDSSRWQNITTNIDTTSNWIEGVTPTLSPFAIGDLLNSPPLVDADGPYSGDEGSWISLDGTGSSDPDGDVLTYAWTVNSPLCSFSDPTVLNPILTCDDNGSYIVTLTVADEVNDPVSSDADVTVNNFAPSVGPITTPMDPFQLGSPINANASFSDPAGSNDEPYICMVDYGDDDGPQYGTVTNTECTGPSNSYIESGVYLVMVTVTDKDGGSGSATASNYVVVYDPNAGFVTGGGWIDSPEGAYAPDPSLTGKANFGFVSKYKKGASVPTGNTEFQFKTADLNFHSSIYDWLVVTGSDYAMFKGTGTINGQGEYKFILWARDNEPDAFRIKIWEEDDSRAEMVIYDNESDQPIGGGNIVIHTK